MSIEIDPQQIGAQSHQLGAQTLVAGATATPLIVHLVHGTWPEGIFVAVHRMMNKKLPYPSPDGEGCWFQSPHSFRKKLERELISSGFAPDIRPYIWSGANSFRERAAAAEDFVAHLARGVYQDARQIIIGHSHGGTVALLALKLMADGATPRAIDKGKTVEWLPLRHQSARDLALVYEETFELPVEQARRGAQQVDVITLATPFLRVEKFGSSKFLWNIFGLCWMTVFCAISVWTARRFGQANVYPLLFGVSVAAGLVARGINTTQAFVQREIVHRQPLAFPGRRIQCIRGISDEAGMGINLGIIGCNVIRTLLVLFGKSLSGVSILLLAFGYFALLGLMTYALFASPTDPVLHAIYLASLGAGALIAFMALASLLQGALGVELAWAGFNFLTTVESVPDASRQQLEVTTLLSAQDSAEGLRHSIYRHPDCVASIVAGVVA